ncbi:MAG TPA: hypothetical protein DER19_04220 [Eubacterium sp.]|nr:hypothetical protein [Eubacterium sp.]
MNKQKRTFLILTIVLVACLAGYLGLLNYNKYKSDDDSESESDSVEALSLDSSDVNSVSFLIDGQEYSFSRIKSESSDSDDDEQWVCDNDTSLKINTSKVTSLLGNATSITASKKFDSDADISDFGLDEPQNVVKLSTDDKTYTITIGEKNAMLGEYYIKVNDDVYLSGTTILGTIPDSIDDMIATEDSESTETESE